MKLISDVTTANKIFRNEVLEWNACLDHLIEWQSKTQDELRAQGLSFKDRLESTHLGFLLRQKKYARELLKKKLPREWLFVRKRPKVFSEEVEDVKIKGRSEEEIKKVIYTLIVNYETTK